MVRNIIKGTWMSKRSKDERGNKGKKVPTIVPPKSLVVTAKNKK
jgi:hypothetical protein